MTKTKLKKQKEIIQDNLETSAHFATAIYSLSKPNFVAPALAVFEERIAKQKAMKEMDPLYPVYMTDNLFLDEKLNEFSVYVASTAWNILNSQGYKMDDKIVYFHSMWGQEHHKSSNMEEHVHNDGVQIVGFYFLEVPENSPQVIFSDPRNSKIQAGLVEADYSKVSMASSKISFKPEVGKFFFTNSWLPHAFSRHGNDAPIKFIHMNLSVQFAPKQEAVVI